MKTHNLIQGSQAWHDYRATHFNASDTPAMLGLSPYKSRSELLHEMATGQVPDIDPATQRRFDDGHRFEALARPLAEKIIGKDLYPVTGSDGKLSASFDGLTMAEDTAFEHKTLNESLRKAFDEIDTMAPEYRETVSAGQILPDHYRAQMEHQLLVSGAGRVLFMASKWKGDELVEERHCWYTSDPAIRVQIVSGWEQFAKDLAAYVPPEVIVAAVAAPQMGLPAVSITVNGSIALVDNLDKFGAALTAYVDRINKKPETDQDFADLEATVKTLRTAEEALDSAESSALAQTDSIDTMRRTVALYRETARTNRLLVEKLVKAEKENRRNALVIEAANELAAHIANLNKAIGKPYMPSLTADFQSAIKGLKSLDSMKDKLSTEVARCKIAANEVADRVRFNLQYAQDHIESTQITDIASLVLKASDDFAAVVQQRLTAQIQREAEVRERIRVEEQAKAESAARAKLEKEQAEAAAAELATAKASEGAELSPAALALYEAEGTASFAKAHPKVTHETVVEIMMPASVKQAMAPKTETPPTLTLGEISSRLSFNVTSAFLATLGFEATTVKAAKLYHSDDFTAICQALINHISEVQDQFEAVAA